MSDQRRSVRVGVVLPLNVLLDRPRWVVLAVLLMGSLATMSPFRPPRPDGLHDSGRTQ